MMSETFQRTVMIMKIFRMITALVCCVALLLTGCSSADDGSGDSDSKGSSKKQTSDKALYTIGLDVISTMDEMLKSKEYFELMGVPSSVMGIVDGAKENDYDSPAAVYDVTVPDTQTYLEIIDSDNSELYSRLSDSLKEQVGLRLFPSVFVSRINAEKGDNFLAFSSLYQASKVKDSIYLKKPRLLLYTFDEGASIVVSFTERGVVTGQFVFIDNADSFSELEDSLDELGCSIEKLDVR